MYDVFSLWKGSVSTRGGGEKLRGTCNIICELFEDKFAFILGQGTHRRRCVRGQGRDRGNGIGIEAEAIKHPIKHS